MIPIKSWHFTTLDRKLRHGDGRIVTAGETISVDCEPVLCKSGLHASVDPLDALRWASGPYVWRVEVGAAVVEGDDKISGTTRKALWGLDASDLLRRFARRCALDVVHLWGAPPAVVRWLKTGDESLREEAYTAADAACSAAYYAVHSAASDAASDAVHSATYSAVHSAACSAAKPAARKTLSRRLASMIHAEHRRLSR